MDPLEPLIPDPEAPQDGTAEVVQETEHWTRKTARQLYSSLANLGICVVMGFLTAVGLKTIGQSVAIAIVLLFIAIQVLAYYGFVNFSWSAVGGAVAKRLDLNKDGRVNYKDMGIACTRAGKWALSWGVPSILGFSLGFWVGWKLL